MKNVGFLTQMVPEHDVALLHTGLMFSLYSNSTALLHSETDL